MTVGLIVNPTAGRGAGRNNHQVILDAFAKLGVEVLDLTSRSKDEAEAKARVAIANEKIHALVVAGGDGMVHLGPAEPVTILLEHSDCQLTMFSGRRKLLPTILS
ncbi:MAG: hypothetical protein RLZZ340_867 [Actinomycetota bacterium]